uniref:Glypican-6-like n=1 Tax=Syphacia muris TaxID=451379 RepID=A0A0N5AT32_9BILA
MADTDKLSEKHVGCIKNLMPMLRPFGDIPEKLVVLMQRSLGTARSFTSTLRSVSKLLSALQRKQLPSDCKQAVTQISYCSSCQSMNPIQPCQQFCHRALRSCLYSYTELQEHWSRLTAPMVLAILSVHINVLRSLTTAPTELCCNYLKLIISHCIRRGFGSVMRQKRDSFSSTSVPNFVELSEQKGSQLNELTTEFLQKLKLYESMWKNLPEQLCLELKVINESSRNCWNGTDFYQDALSVNQKQKSVAKTSEHFKYYTSDNDVFDERLLMRVLIQRLSEVYVGKWSTPPSTNVELEHYDSSGYIPEYFPVDDEIELQDESSGSMTDDDESIGNEWLKVTMNFTTKSVLTTTLSTNSPAIKDVADTTKRCTAAVIFLQLFILLMIR